MSAKPTKPKSDEQNASAFAPEPIRRIAQAQNSLSLKQRMLAHYMLQHPEKIGFLSIRELAKNASVSIATVSRFCAQLGYGGYDEFGREVQRSLQYEMSTPARFRLFDEATGNPDAPPLSPFERVLDMELENLLTMRRVGKPEEMQRCIEWLNQADAVFVVGAMGSAAMAEYLAYAISKVRDQVHLVTAAKGTPAWLALSNSSPETLVFLIGFPRYQHSTIEIGQFARGKNARIVALTDRQDSPLAKLADITFPVSISFSTVVDSFAAPIVLIHALVAEYSERYRDEVHENLLKFEQYTADLDIWEQSPPKK